MSSGKTLPQVHNITPLRHTHARTHAPPHPPPHPPTHTHTHTHTHTQIQLLLQKKRGRKPQEPSGLSKVLDFAAFLNYKSFNSVLCLERFYPQFALYLQHIPFLIHTIYMPCLFKICTAQHIPFLIHTIYMPCLFKICTAHIYFAVLNGNQTTSEMVAYLISRAKFYKTLKGAR